MSANLLVCDGKPGPVLRVSCKKRKGTDSFVIAMRKILTESFPDKFIGLGGVFVILEGKLKTHIMPNFDGTSLETGADLAGWLKFHEMTSPFTCASVFYNKDPVRSLFTHTWSLSICLILKRGKEK